MEGEIQEIRLPVRGLCEWLLRSGSLDNRYGGQDRLAEGGRIHRRLQREAPPGYRAEVFVRGRVEQGNVAYLLEGRADGVYEREGLTVIDEIKSTAHPLEDVGEDFDRAHWGQAQCYAWLYAREHGEARMGMRLRYVQADTLEIREFWREMDVGELEAFVYGLLDRYRRWADFRAGWAGERNQSITALPFPFKSYRPGQRLFAVAVYRTIQARGRLFCQAPTGVGKTVSALFPAIKAVGEGLAEKIFYFTAKAVTRRVAAGALQRMRRSGLRLKSVVLTAKDLICPQTERECNPARCPYADGYYDRRGDAILSMLQSEDHFTRESVEACAERYRVCPFELSLDLSEWCDAVVGDYNHLFDPVASLKRFFSEGGEYVFLIDEAHNLVDRARDMYSATLEKGAVLALRRAARSAGERPLERALGKLSRALLELSREWEPEEKIKVFPTPPEGVLKAARVCAGAMDEWLAGAGRESPVRRAALEFYFSLSFFLRIAELFGEDYAVYARRDARGVTVRLLCLDPSAALDACMDKGRAAALFSATLTPAEYFVSVLGGGEKAKKLALPSPYDPGHLGLFVADRVSTRFKDRERSRAEVAGLLHTLCAARRGHYLFFFPSYQYMREVYDVFREAYPEEKTLLQSLSPDEREMFLEAFDREDGEALAGFCVLGGVFAEGVDLHGERLIGAAVVGVGLPQLSEESDMVRDHYERRGGRGFDFAYRFPGMNKVLQAAGRVIRGEEDRGAVLLIDSRFSTPAYRSLFPDHWSGWRRAANEEELGALLRSFWDLAQF